MDKPELEQPSFMRGLCMGDIDADLILPYPELAATDREILREVIDSVDTLLRRHETEFRAWDERAELPPEFIEELKAFGMFGLVIPEEHGGLGFKSASYSRTLERVARYDASVAVTIGAHSSIGMRVLLLFGTEQQRAPLLSRACDRRAHRCLLFDRTGLWLRRRLDSHNRGARGRSLGTKWREAVDHQRWHGALLHGLCQDVDRRWWQDDGIPRHA